MVNLDKALNDPDLYDFLFIHLFHITCSEDIRSGGYSSWCAYKVSHWCAEGKHENIFWYFYLSSHPLNFCIFSILNASEYFVQ